MKKIAVLGFGGRGTGYSYLCKKMKNDFEIVAVIDTSKDKLNLAKKILKLDDNQLFSSLDEYLKQQKNADWMFVCTQDKLHLEHSLKAIQKGFNLLLEKPVACTAEDCIEIENQAQKYNVEVAVCHVLRYSKYYSKIKSIIDSGILGQIIAIDQVENVGYWHQAHSFVRGDWGNSQKSNPMILAKCCHDLDIAVYLSDSKCVQVSSQGKLNFFNKEHAPEGATQYCLGGCKAKDKCPYDAEKLYLDTIKHLPSFAIKYMWPQSRLMKDGVVTRAKLYEAIKSTDFGKCVFLCDNDVVDYQVSTMIFENGITSTLTMTAFSDKVYRETRIRGTLGNLQCDMTKNYMILNIFGKRKKRILLGLGGDPHGGGDYGLIKALAKDNIKTDISKSIESHLIAFACEQSRQNNGMPVNLDSLRKTISEKNK